VHRRSHRRGLTGIALPVVLLMSAPGQALSAMPLRSWDIWCLAPENRASVVRTADSLGYGRAVGVDRARIELRDSTDTLNLDEWRRASPGDFDSACRKTFKAFRQDGISPAEMAALSEEIEDMTSEVRTTREVIDETDDGISKEAEVGITTIAGLVAAGIGVAGGYQVTKRARNEERRHAQADALDEELGWLSADIGTLGQKTLSGTAGPEDYTATYQRAMRLLNNVPATPQGQAARNALTALLNALAGPQDQMATKAEASLREITKDVEKEVSAIASRLRDGAQT
jgi:hypothetical protein